MKKEGPNLATPLRYFKGVGPERSKLLARLGLERLGDAFSFFPKRYEDRRLLKTVSEICLGEKVCARGVIQSRGIIRTRSRQSILRAVISDGKALLFAAWFNQPYLLSVLTPKSRIVLYGSVEKDGRHLQMIHPEYEIVTDGPEKELIHSGRIAPVYPLTEDLGQKGLRQLLFRITQEYLYLVEDPFPEALRKDWKLAGSRFAFQNIHFPASFPNLEKATRRLVFDEFLLMQLMIQMKKAALKNENEAILHRSGEKEVERLIGSLDFELTHGQKNAIDDILNDMKQARPMNRLVQGDVGSGKTAVAAAALVFTAANGFQGALMAPTEVLAQQHYFKMAQTLEPLGFSCGYLGPGLSVEERQKTLLKAVSGEIQILIGTHSLIQESVRFKKLGLAVIDEQHKFGVFQRGILKEKGQGSAHLLLMTATPIPRTLALTLYGDLDISTIREMPKGRGAVTTSWVGENKRHEIYAFLDSLIQKGRQGYVICPLVGNESEASLKSALEHHKELSNIFSHHKVGVLHGRMKSAEKKKIMQDFKNGATQILVSTVVIEVGIDVPNASVMIIENAERFGLAQLHQLRGRVGRGEWEAFCILFSEAQTGETAERLGAFEDTKSGFEIAEKDLKLRGAGEIIGEKQHGFPELRIGDLNRDIAILEEAKRAAIQVLAKDPELKLLEHQKLKLALKERFELLSNKPVVLA